MVCGMASRRSTRTQLLAEVEALQQQVAHLTAAATVQQQTAEALQQQVAHLTAAATVQQQTAEALHDAQLYAQSLIETVREPLVVLGADLRVLSANRAFYRFFSTTPTATEQVLFSELEAG